jgi:hypothetical protein
MQLKQPAEDMEKGVEVRPSAPEWEEEGGRPGCCPGCSKGRLLAILFLGRGPGRQVKSAPRLLHF